MKKNELIPELTRLARLAEDENDALAGILHAVRGALLADNEYALFRHVMEFVEAELARIEVVKAAYADRRINETR